MDDNASRPPSTTFTQASRRRREEIAALIARLMSHYWTADDHPASRKAQAEDWIEDLVEFEVRDVNNACVEWRRSQHRRPTPSDIRSLAIAEQRNRQARAEIRALPSPRRVERPKVLHPWETGYAERYDEPWFRALDYETQQRYMAQDQERLEMHNRVLGGLATDQEFAALCINQATDNLAKRQRVKPEAKMTQAEINAAMGVAAAAQKPKPKYMDQEELRRGRRELGLEE